MKYIILPLFLAAIILNITSCNDTVQFPEASYGIDQAKVLWNDRSSIDTKHNNLNSRNYTSDIMPLWDKYQVFTAYEDIEYLKIPITSSNIKVTRALGFETNDAYGSYLLFIINDDGPNLYVVNVVRGSGNQFDEGVVTVTDLSGEFVSGYHFSDGTYQAIGPTGTSLNGKTEGVECYYIDHYTCTVRQEGPDDCILDYTTLHCEYTKAPKSLFGDGSGEGGGPGDGPLLTNPVECDEGYLADADGNCINNTCEEGFEKDRFGNCVKKKPCTGDPVTNVKIASQTNSGIAGGLHGCTRFGSGCPNNNSKKIHDGIDIVNDYGDPVYAMYSGFIYNTLYDSDGAGYWTQIQSKVNGSVIITQYYHLQKQNRVTSGSVNAGDIIGYQGTSGNLGVAIKQGLTTSHVHIGVRQHDGSSNWNYYKNFTQVDPKDFLSTKINSDGTTSENDCN